MCNIIVGMLNVAKSFERFIIRNSNSIRRSLFNHSLFKNSFERKNICGNIRVIHAETIYKNIFCRLSNDRWPLGCVFFYSLKNCGVFRCRRAVGNLSQFFILWKNIIGLGMKNYHRTLHIFICSVREG